MRAVALGPQLARTASHTVAYFCLEYAIEDNLPIYAGGLGVLSGDLVLEAGQQGVNLVAIGLFYSRGFGEQKELDPRQSGFVLEPTVVPVEVGSNEINVQVWSKNYGSAKLYLLDGGEITKYLYGPDQATMLKQQIVLGIGGVRLLRRLNIEPDVYHLNEGHTAMVLLELAKDYLTDSPKSSLESALQIVGQKIVATKHTIFTGAGLHLSREEMQSAVKLYLETHQINFDELFPLGVHKNQPEVFATANFLLKYAHRQSGVSHLHVTMEKTIHPNSQLIPITNGVNVSRWDQWKNRKDNKAELIRYLNRLSPNSLIPDHLTLVWARRFASYKRPELLFADMARLKKMLINPDHPVQLVMAGKTNPTDQTGKELVGKIKSAIAAAGLGKNVVFLEDYSLPLAKKLVAGADVWLNTPIPGKEACGTSGMKAGLNGALMVSTNDGWMAEVNWHDLGWILPENDIEEVLYEILEKNVVPLYYGDQAEWQRRSLRTRSLVLKHFNTERMLKEYLEKLYP